MQKMERGQVVLSTAGRDAGHLFIILSSEEGFALIADGKIRRLESPKRKRFRHLKPAGLVLDITALTTNRQLRRTIRAVEAETTLPPI